MTGPSDTLADVERLKASVSIAVVINETLQLNRNGRQLVALCPFHNERTASFTVYDAHYHCFGCGAHGDVFDWLLATRRLTFRQAVEHLKGCECSNTARYQPRPAPRLVPARSATTDIFLRAWDGGVDPVGTIVQTYLRNRGGLTIPEGAPIRFHPNCQRGRRDLRGGPEYWPAMLALMTHPITGQPVGVHRTYLRPDGSAQAPVTVRDGTVLTSKRILGTWGIVRLTPDAEVGRVLAIAEGIENALTASQIIGWEPVWSVGSQHGIARFPLLPLIEALTIFADADDSGAGMKASRECAKRWAEGDREVSIQIPPSGTDWNDAASRLVQ